MGAQAKKGGRPRREAGQERRRVKKGCADREGANQERVRRRREGVKAKKGARKTRSLRETRKPEGEASVGRGEA